MLQQGDLGALIHPANQNIQVPATADFHQKCACQTEKELFPVCFFSQDNRVVCYYVIGRSYKFTYKIIKKLKHMSKIMKLSIFSHQL